MALDLTSLIGDAIGGGAAKIIGAFKEDPTKKAELQSIADQSTAEFKLKALELTSQIQQEINAQANSIALAQIAVNEAEAKGNRFQSSWRPLIGYICGAGLLYQELLRPIINFTAQCFGSKAVAESLDMGTLITLLFGLLGLGVMRTTEKLNDKD